MRDLYVISDMSFIFQLGCFDACAHGVHTRHTHVSVFKSSYHSIFHSFAYMMTMTSANIHTITMTSMDLYDTTVLSLACDALAQVRAHDMPPGWRASHLSAGRLCPAPS